MILTVEVEKMERISRKMSRRLVTGTLAMSVMMTSLPATAMEKISVTVYQKNAAIVHTAQAWTSNRHTTEYPHHRPPQISSYPTGKESSPEEQKPGQGEEQTSVQR